MHVNKSPITGCLLISKPLIGDGYFEQSVVLITDHSAAGTVGMVLNKVSTLFVHDFLENIHGTHPIYFGGPVEDDALFYVHNITGVDGAEEVLPGLYFGGDFAEVSAGIDHEDTTVGFFLGYSGWSPGQLQAELEEDTWVVVHPPYTFNPLSFDQQKWSRWMKRLGGEYTLWANAPEDPWMN